MRSGRRRPNRPRALQDERSVVQSNKIQLKIYIKLFRLREYLYKIFPMWQIDFQNSQVQLRQKDLMSQVEDASHRDFEGLFPPQEQSQLRCFMGCWADGWVRYIPNLIFDNYLSNDTFSDSISIRLGLPLFDIDEICPQYPQISDQYDHHNLT